MRRRYAEAQRVRRVRGAARAAAALGALVATSATARAFPTARLEYERGTGTESCPDQAALIAAVAERLGYDPFSPDAGQTLRARIERSQEGFAAVIELRDAAAALVAERHLGNAGGCAELAAAMALSMSIVIDPERALERTSAPSGGPAPELPVSAGPPSREAPPRPPSARPLVAPSSGRQGETPPIPSVSSGAAARGSVGAALHVALGLEPNAALGVSVFAGARRGPFSVTLEAQYDAPASDALPSGGRLSAQFFGANAVPCFHYTPFAACAVALAGFLRVESRGVPDARADAGFFAAFGPRLGLEWPIVAHVSLFAQGDFLFSLRPLSVKRSDAEVWESPLASGRLASGFVTFF